MSGPVSRRKWLKAGAATAAGVAGLGTALKIADHYGLIPPDCWRDLGSRRDDDLRGSANADGRTFDGPRI